MPARLRSYALALASVLVTGGIRYLLIPVLGNRMGFDLFLISTFVCGRYLGFGPSVFALLAGGLGVTYFHFTRPALADPYFEVGLLAYLTLGAIVVLLCRSQHSARIALEHEIEDRKRVESDLRSHRQQLLLAIGARKIGTWHMDMRTQHVIWSPRMEEIHGYAPGAFGGTLKEAIAHNHPDDQMQIEARVAVAESAEGLTYRVITEEGKIRWVEGVGQTIQDASGTPIEMVGICFDVTTQKEVELALRQAENQFRELATHAPVGIFQTDRDGRCQFVNDAWCQISGASLEDALGAGWQRFLHPDDRQRVSDEWQEATRYRRNHHMDFRFENPARGTRNVLASATVLLDPAGEVTGYVGTIVDVTERQAAEDALRASKAQLHEREERLRLAVEATNIGTFDFNPLTGERNWSARAKVMWGLAADADVTNISFLDRVHPDDRARAAQAFEQALDPNGDGKYSIDCRVIWPDGSLHWFVAKAQTLFEGARPNRRPTRFLGTVLEITERKQIEAGLREALEAVEAKRQVLRRTIEIQDQERQLIAYEIHDGMVQYAAAALMRAEAIQCRPESAPLATEIDGLTSILRSAVDEGRRLINGIRTPVLDDWGIVAAVQQLIDEEDRAHVEVEFIKDDKLRRMTPRIEETLYRITQEALNNIHKHSHSKKVRIELAQRGDRVHLEVRDWGVGFHSPDHLPSGHGLAGMAQRAKISGGHFNVSSTPGEGTRIAVDVPYVSKD